MKNLVNFRKNLMSAGVAFALGFAATSASAAIDPAPVVTEIAANSAGILAVGGAILGIVALVLGFRLLRKITG